MALNKDGGGCARVSVGSLVSHKKKIAGDKREIIGEENSEKKEERRTKRQQEIPDPGSKTWLVKDVSLFKKRQSANKRKMSARMSCKNSPVSRFLLPFFFQSSPCYCNQQKTN